MKKNEKIYKGKIYSTPALWSLFESTWQAFGFTNFAKFLTRPNKIKKVFDDRGKFLVEVLKRFIDWGEENIVFLFDDYLFLSPKLKFEVGKYIFINTEIGGYIGSKIFHKFSGGISLII